MAAYNIYLLLFSGNKKGLGGDGDNSYTPKAARKEINTNAPISINKKNSNLRTISYWFKA